MIGESPRRDFVHSLFLALVLLVVLMLISLTIPNKTLEGFNEYISFYKPSYEDLNLLIVVLTTLLGVLLTILTLFYVFEHNLIKNKGFKLLVAHNKHTEIYERYTDSIFAIFAVIVVLVMTYLFKIPSHEMGISTLTYILFVSCLSIFAFIRAYHSFDIFRELLLALNEVNKSETE